MPPIPWHWLVYGWGVSSALLFILFIIQLRTRNAATADVGWTVSAGAMAVAFAFLGSGDPVRRVLLAVIAGLWSLRLGTYILRRILSSPEDTRYAAVRAHVGAKAPLVFFAIYEVQPLLTSLLAIPFLVVAQNRAPLSPWDGLGIGIWLAGVAGESIADRHLARFKRRPENRGNVCREGLWRYSRHPNYFFEWVTWWCYVPLAVGHPQWWLAFIGPVMMWVFLLYITGVPPAERQSLKSKPEAYRDYQRTTSRFVPWFPKG